MLSRSLQVGKRAPQAASHTDTSFKSKRVRVSAQSILHDLGDVDAVTARGQGVQVTATIVLCRDYSVCLLSPGREKHTLVFDAELTYHMVHVLQNPRGNASFWHRVVSPDLSHAPAWPYNELLTITLVS